jgi:hypothetical protein
MSRCKQSKWNYAVYDRMLRNGRGQGHLSAYKPWITVYDFPSNGKVARILGKKTNRVHHLLSSLETRAFTLVRGGVFFIHINHLITPTFSNTNI